MVMVELKGIHVVRNRATGAEYHYAWRGGPRLSGTPGSPEYHRSFNEAVADRKTVDSERFASVIVAYKASDSFRNLAPSTRKEWSRWLDRIGEEFGTYRTALFDRPDRIRPLIRKWRGKFADKPRTADYGMQVLSRVLSHAVDPLGKIATNPCEGIKRLYGVDRSEIIWTDDDLAAIKAECSAELALAFDLAAHTGLRMGDLVQLSWSHIGETHIEIATGKGRRKNRRAIIPLYGDLRALLARIPKRATTVLTSTRKRPWTVTGISSSIQDAKTESGLRDKDLHFHDLRGTAATKFYLAGLKVRVIAEILAWEEEAVEKIIRRYVGRHAATLEAIRALDGKAEAGTEPVKTAVKSGE
ncbi:MAG: tyrosine-type recombinase/integrase [Rhizobiales bacterium]|nr:tyrosine-type recombinase/integrase [Hyphomicrobiales bacterium]